MDTIKDKLNSDKVPYTINFSEVDEIFVLRTDYTKGMAEDGSRPELSYKIQSEENSSEICSLLSSLPKEGHVQVSMAPTITRLLVGYKNGEPIAQVIFYGGMLNAEQSGFYGMGDELMDKIKRVFDIVMLEEKNVK